MLTVMSESSGYFLFTYLAGLLSWLLFSSCGNFVLSMWIILSACANFPMVLASQVQDPFPDITFRAFSDIIDDHFSSKVSLATVLSVMFTLTENPELLNLHGRMQNPRLKDERKHYITGWMSSLARALQKKLGQRADLLFKTSEKLSSLDDQEVTYSIATKLDTLAKRLNLTPYDKYGQFEGKLKPVSDHEIQPALVICPQMMECTLSACNNRSLLQQSRSRDLSHATLIKGTRLVEKVPVLIGQCSNCQSSYHGDYYRTMQEAQSRTWNRTYLNEARYLRIGTAIWADRIFSTAVLNGIYSFHASASS